MAKIYTVNLDRVPDAFRDMVSTVVKGAGSKQAVTLLKSLPNVPADAFSVTESVGPIQEARDTIGQALKSGKRLDTIPGEMFGIACSAKGDGAPKGQCDVLVMRGPAGWHAKIVLFRESDKQGSYIDETCAKDAGSFTADEESEESAGANG